MRLLFFLFSLSLNSAECFFSTKPPKPSELPTKTALFSKADDYCEANVLDACQNKFCVAYCFHGFKNAHKDDERWFKECKAECTRDYLCNVYGDKVMLDNPLTIQIRAMYNACLHEMAKFYDPRNASPPPSEPVKNDDKEEKKKDEEPLKKEKEAKKKEEEKPDPSEPEGQNWPNLITKEWKDAKIEVIESYPDEEDYEDN